MDQERYQRLQELFLEARELDDEACMAFVNEQEDAELADELRSLLDHDRTSDQLLRPIDASTMDVGISEVVSLQERPRETQAGPYELIEVLGEGGFGTVYRGVQRSPIERQAAVKLIKPGMDSQEVLARFDGERRTLAKLQHPSIAQVYDVGTTERGLPFFAMELVHGIPIDRFCEENQLTIDSRIRLFEQVCEAVHHAHRRGILHRDIKPSNVLAMFGDQARPRAMVIDFGISKALQSEPLRDDEREQLTQQGQVLGTLEYMSPEQASLDSRELDIRTDIYSLGALFYRILTGQPPIERERLLSSGYWKIYETLMETTIKRPSEIASLPSRDLDWIVMKTLEKDRELRYSTVHDLVRDLQRFREGVAIEARPPSIGYQFRLLLARHWMPILVVSVVMVALLVGTAGSLWGWRTASLARDDAVQERQNAEDSLAKLNRALYSTHVANAWSAFQDRNTVTARRLLDETPVALRGFEWELLDQQVGRGNLRLLSPPGQPAARQLDFELSQSQLAGVRDDGSVFVSDADGQVTQWKSLRRATTVRWLDNQTLLVGLSGGVVSKRDRSGNEISRSSWGPRGGVYDIAIHGGALCTVCFGDGGVLLADTGSFSVKKQWKAPTRMSRLHFGADQAIYGSGFDGRIHRFDSDGRRAFPSGTSGPVHWAWDSEGRGLVMTGKMLQRYRASDDPQADARWKLAESEVWTHFESIGERRWLLGGRDGKLATIDLSNPEAVPVVLSGFDSAISDLEFDSHAREVIVALIDGTIAAMSIDATRSKNVIVEASQRFTAGAPLKGQAALVTLDVMGRLTVWDLKTGKELRSIEAHALGGWEIAASKNLIVTVGEDQTIACWNAADLSLRWRRKIAWGCRSIAISEDENRIASAPPAGMATAEGTIGLYSTTDGELIELLQGHKNWVLKLVFHGDRLLSSCENRTIRLWSIPQKREIRQFVSPKQSVAEHLSFSSDGRRVFSGHRDGSVLVWDAESQQLTHTLSAFGDQISGLERIGNRLVVTCVSDGKMKLFEETELRLVTTLETGTRGLQRLIVAPAHKRLVLYDGVTGRSYGW